MKKLFLTLGFLVLMSSSVFAAEPFAIFFQNTEHPLFAASEVVPSKVGKSECNSFFGIVAVGNCSVKKAMQNGRIRSLSHVDQSVKTILGYSHIETKAYGN